MKTILVLLLLLSSANASLNWAVVPPPQAESAPITSTVKFRIMLDGVEQTAGQVAMTDANGVIRGLGDPAQDAEFLGGKWWYAPLNFKANSAGGEYTINFSPDDSSVYVASDTYTFVQNDPAKTEITISASDLQASPNCLQPATPGYDFSQVSGSIAEASFSITGVACDTGFSGTATATKCAASGQDYSVAGCTEDPTDCLQPATPGYDFSQVSGSRAKASFSITGVACDTGFSGTATATECAAAGQDYSMSGCTEDPTNCIEPSTTGYDFSGVTGSIAKSTFSITNVQCATGYFGNPSTIVCTAAGQVYYVAGCQPDVDCVETETLGTCSNGQQTVTYSTTTAQFGNGVACSADTTQACTALDGAACENSGQCDNICFDSVCRTPVDCVETETVTPCTNGEQSFSYVETSGPQYGGTVCSTDNTQSCKGEVGDTCEAEAHTQCQNHLSCVDLACAVPFNPLDNYELVTSGVPSLGLNKMQCKKYALYSSVTMSENQDGSGPYGCTNNAGAINFDARSNGGGESDACGTGSISCVECVDGVDCEEASVTGGGVATGSIELTADADVDLLTLKLCDSTGSSIDDIDDTGMSYGMIHSLGLVYQRDGLDAERDPVTYCQDQQFITTIARDASASTSVTTLIAPSLQRSIIVHGIDWVQCPSTLLACQGSDDCYKLQIDLSAREKNAEAVSWSNASLSDSFPHQGGANTADMEVVHSLSPTSAGNLISLIGKCGIVDDCSLSATEGHWFDHTSTDQDIVLRGTFAGSNVDSIASIETAFMECPLGATTSYNGELKLGLHLTCEDENGDDAATQTIDSDITGDSGILQNCRSALTSSIVRVTTDVFVDTKNPAGKLAADGWEMKDVDFKFNRYEANVDGTKGRLISSDLMMEMRFDSSTEDWTCTRMKAGITALPLFDQRVMDCDISDITTPTNSATKTGLTHPEAGTIMFDLTPLQEYSNDAYEVEVISMLQNRELEQARRLRTAYTLKTGGLVNEQSPFPLLNTADDDADDHEHHDHESLVGLMIAVVCLLAVIGVGLFMCCRRKGMAAQLATVEEKQGLISARPVRAGLRPRFKNLRY